MRPTLDISADLKLPAEAVTQTFAILAKRGVGKTYAALVLVEELLKSGAQVVVADPVGVTWGLRAAANGKDAGLPIIVMGGDHGDVPLEAGAGKVIAEFVVDTRSSVVLDLSLLRKGEQIRFMTDFAETLYHRNRAPLHLVLDEADAFAPQRPMHDQARMLGAMQDLVRRGRARGIGVTLVTQRAAVLSKDVLTQVEVLVALRTIAPQDREAIDAWIQAHDAHGQRAEFMASLASLPIGTAWFWSPGWLDVFRKVRVRARETFDSSATPKVGTALKAPKKLAAVDLEQLKGRIAATIEKAKADDPRELRRRIAHLEAELSKKSMPAPAKERRVEIPVLTASDLKRLEAAAEKISNVGQGAIAVAQKLTTELLIWRTDLSKPPAPPPVAPRANAPAPRSPSLPTTPVVGHEAKVLHALARFAALNVRQVKRNLVAAVAKISPRSSAFDTALRRLRAAEQIVYPSEGVLELTGAGAAAAPAVASPPTSAELIDGFAGILEPSQARVLRALTGAYPAAVDRDELARRASVSPTSSAYDVALRVLRDLGVATYPAPSQVRASEDLFR